jgi:hypothetical protein
MKSGYANSSGSTLERMVREVMLSKGFEVATYSQYKKHPNRFGTELLLEHAPYTTIYGHTGKTEFLLVSAQYGLHIRIECKWQQSSGSVDEKFPYVYLNAIEAMPEKDIIIVVGGAGAKKGAVEWLKRAAREQRYGADEAGKNVQVMSIDEFVAWANRTFR